MLLCSGDILASLGDICDNAATQEDKFALVSGFLGLIFNPGLRRCGFGAGTGRIGAAAKHTNPGDKVGAEGKLQRQNVCCFILK